MSTGFTKALGRNGHTLIKHNECLKANLAFQSGSSSSPGYLSVGLITGIGTISSYVIEWHLGSPTGSIIFKSGLNPNETVNAIHPFTNEPVTSGNLYAVVKYIVIDGIKYSTYPNLGQYSPDLKICFNYIPVSGINCANGVTGDYSHSYVYVNNLTFETNAARTLKFYLNSDGTTNYFAWKFIGWTVADRITISYIRLSDVENPIILSDWIIGTGSNPNNYTLEPKQLSYQDNLKLVLKLSDIGHQPGDYLLINIIPRVKEPTNVNTNWNLYLKCLSSYDDYIPPYGSNLIDKSTLSMIWNSINCKYELSWKNIAKYNPPSHFSTYMSTIEGSLIDTRYDSTTGVYVLEFDKSTILGESTSSTGSCVNLVGTLNLIKTGSLITGVCTNQTDYDNLKANYDSIVSNPNWTNYSADNTNALHYKYWTFWFRIAATCGDSYTTTIIYAGYNSIVSWDYANKTFTINIVNTDNGFISAPCDSRYTTINSLINIINNSINLANFNVITGVRLTGAFRFAYKHLSILEDTIISNKNFDYRVLDASMCSGLVPTAWRALGVPTYGMFGYRKCYVTGIITDTTDPINNFRLDSRLNADGVYSTDKDIADPLYEKINGILYNILTSAAGLVVNSVGWTNFTLSNLNTFDYNAGYTTSLTDVFAVLNGFQFSGISGTIANLSLYLSAYTTNTSGIYTFKFRFSKDDGVSWSNYSSELIGSNTNNTPISMIRFNYADFGITLSDAELNSSLFRIEVAGHSNSVAYRASITYLKLLVYTL